MTFAKVDLIGALRARYDHYSAESMFGVARERAELADKAAYDAAEVRALRGVLAGINDRLATVLARLDAMLAEGGAAPAAPAPTPAPEPKADVKAEAKPEAKADKHDARADKHDAKADKHKDGGKHGGKHKDGGKHARDEARAEHKDEAAGTTLVLTGVEVAEGEQILVCGGLPALGDWDPAHACVMAREGDAWLATLPVAPDAEVAFKFARRAKDGTVTWEAGDNRRLAGKARVETTWR